MKTGDRAVLRALPSSLAKYEGDTIIVKRVLDGDLAGWIEVIDTRPGEGRVEFRAPARCVIPV